MVLLISVLSIVVALGSLPAALLVYGSFHPGSNGSGSLHSGGFAVDDEGEYEHARAHACDKGDIKVNEVTGFSFPQKHDNDEPYSAYR